MKIIVEKNKLKNLWQLLISAFSISCVTFGGGFVIISMMRKKFVEQFGWITEEEMLDIAAIAQSAPGPIVINAFVILGYRVCGISGAVAGVIGTSLPPLIIISVISAFYTQFRDNRVIATALRVMRAGVAAVIFDVVINLAKNVINTKRAFYIILMAAAFAAKCIFGAGASTIIIVCLAVGICDFLFGKLKKKEGN